MIESYDSIEMQRYVEGLQAGLINAEHRGGGVWGPQRMQRLQLSFTETGSGLLLPTDVARGSIPLDYIKTYLIDSEVFGGAIGEPAVERLLRVMPLDNVLLFCAEIMARMRHPEWDHRRISLNYAERYLEEPYRGRVLNTLRTDPRRILVAPQAVFALLKRSLEMSPPGYMDPTDEFDPNFGLMYILLAIAGTLGGDDLGRSQGIEDIGWVGRHLSANQYLNYGVEMPGLMSTAHFRWVDNNDGLRAVYRDAVGVDPFDVMTLGLLLWGQANQSVDRLGIGRFVAPVVDIAALVDDIKWEPGRLTAALNLFCADPIKLRDATLDDERINGREWSINAISRFPVLMIHGKLLILDSHLLLKRTLGWLLLFDVKEAGDNSAFNKADGLFRSSAESYVAEVLRGICGDPRRFYDETTLRRRLGGKGIRIADAAIDYGTSWVVVETTTLQARRRTLGGIDESDISADIDQLVDKKVEQLHSTIAQLKVRGDRMSGYASTVPRRYYPVLVMSEGFPVNPVTLHATRERARKKGMLSSVDIAPLEIVDVDELEMIEGLPSDGGPTLPEIFEGKSASQQWRGSMQHYVHGDLAQSASVPLRVKERYQQMFETLISPLEPTQEGVQM